MQHRKSIFMKKTYIIIFTVICVLVLSVALWYYRFVLENFSKNLPSAFNAISGNQQVSQIKNTASQIFTPPPLKSTENDPNSNLTRAGVITITNEQRNENSSLPALKENSLLDKAAQAKLKDMFAKQYFEHISPSGLGPSDLAKNVGYGYIMIGENLALGNFKDDRALVTAWMNSPGHRENILNSKYLDIGVAVGQGTYEGQKTWLAVQEFGRPTGSCPAVDIGLKSQIDTQQIDVTNTQSQITALKKQVDSLNPQMQAEYDTYNKRVAEYNDLIRVYNNKVGSLKLIVNQYNSQVKAYDACLGN